MGEYNVALQRWIASRADRQGGAAKGDESSLERVHDVANVRWQTRAAPPTAYENALGDALQAIFAEEIYDLPDVVRRLNERGVRSPDGAPWTDSAFTAEMARLGN